MTTHHVSTARRMARPLTADERARLEHRARPCSHGVDPYAGPEHADHVARCPVVPGVDALGVPLDPRADPACPACGVYPGHDRDCPTFGTCPACGLVRPRDSHPCRFAVACSCWRGVPCRQEGDPRD